MKYVKQTREGENPRIVAVSDNAVVYGKKLVQEEITREEAENALADPDIDVDDSVLQEIAVRDEAKQSMLAFGQSVREQTVAGAHYITIGLWIMKAIRAERYLAGNATERDMALLQLEATSRNRGESVEDLAKKIDANSVHLQTAGVVTESMEKATGDMISAADSESLPGLMKAVMAQASSELGKISAGSLLDEAGEIKSDLDKLKDRVEK